MQITEDMINTLHAKYFAAVQQLFEKHMAAFPGYQDLKLVMH